MYWSHTHTHTRTYFSAQYKLQWMNLKHYVLLGINLIFTTRRMLRIFWFLPNPQDGAVALKRSCRWWLWNDQKRYPWQVSGGGMARLGTSLDLAAGSPPARIVSANWAAWPNGRVKERALIGPTGGSIFWLEEMWGVLSVMPTVPGMVWHVKTDVQCTSAMPQPSNCLGSVN